MKKLICGLGLVLGLSLSCHAQGVKISAYPNTNNLAGTNLFLIAIVGSPGTNMNISYAQLSNLLATAIGGGGGGAQVWTNEGPFVWLSGFPSVDTNGTYAPGPPFFFHTNGSRYVGPSVNQDANVWDSTVLSPLYAVSFKDSNSPPSQTIYQITANNENEDYQSVFRVNNALNGSDNSTAAFSLRVDETNSNSAEMTVTLNCDDDPTHSVSTLNLSANGTVGVSLVGANGTILTIGAITCPATLYKSNASPAIPTGATLGAGGYWTGNSNGFLVTVYSLDGSTTVMKVLAP